MEMNQKILDCRTIFFGTNVQKAQKKGYLPRAAGLEMVREPAVHRFWAILEHISCPHFLPIPEMQSKRYTISANPPTQP